MDTIELPADLKNELAALDTVSDRIRLLDRKGHARADIARILGKRYQHVRNVLERDAATAPGSATSSASRLVKVPAPEDVLRIEVASDGTMRLPAGVLGGLGLPQGGVLSGRFENGQLTLVEPLVALRRVQEALRSVAARMRAEGRSVVDELIAERRAEAVREGGAGR